MEQYLKVCRRGEEYEKNVYVCFGGRDDWLGKKRKDNSLKWEERRNSEK